MTTNTEDTAPTLEEAVLDLIRSRAQDRLPRVVLDEEDWDQHFPINKGEWRFTYKELPRDQSSITLAWRQPMLKVNPSPSLGVKIMKF